MNIQEYQMGILNQLIQSQIGKMVIYDDTFVHLLESDILIDFTGNRISEVNGIDTTSFNQ